MATAKRETKKLKLTKRSETGKGTCRKLRADGVIPVVFYGPEYKESVVGTVPGKELASVANTPNWETSMIDLEIEGIGTEMALLRNVQRHAITQKILHVDFYQLRKGHKVRVAVPIRYINKEISTGVKAGGMIEQSLRDVEIMVLPREIPAEIIIDVKDMEIGAEVYVRELEFPENAELLTPDDLMVLTVARPRSVLDEAEAEGEGEAGDGETAEVEVVGKGKKKEDEEA